MKLKHVLMLVLAATALPEVSAQTTDRFRAYEKKEFIADGDTLRYRLLKPEAEVQGQKYPLVLFLHGSDKRGRDNEIQLEAGGQMFLNPINREKHPSYVIFPQCPADSFGVFRYHPGEDFDRDEFLQHPQFSRDGQLLKALLDTYLTNPQIDTRRIYVMGISMGGMSTFDMAARFPHIFAAAMPLCGMIYPERLNHAKNVSFRIFQGDEDALVPVEEVREDYKKLKAIGAHVEYFEYPSVDHGVWVHACLEPDFLDWLYNQKKK